jgi:excisionase family DNA binding protein
VTDGKEYLRARDIAELTGLSLRTVRRRIADDLIPSTKFGGARLVARADLEVLLSATPEPTQDFSEDEEECEGNST